MTPNVLTYRDATWQKSVTWLRKGRAQKLLYALAIQIDTLSDMLVSGIKLRFPGLYTYESLPYIGRDRRITRGRNETNTAYASRLQRWLDDHRHRGSGITLLQQLYIHYAPDNFPIDLVYKNGRRYRLATDGTITRDTVTVVPTAQWARWTLYYFTDSFPDPLSDTDRSDLLTIPKQWIAGHALGRLILMRTGTELYDYHVPRKTYDGQHVHYDHPGGDAMEV